MLKKSTPKQLILPLSIFLISCAAFTVLYNLPYIMGEKFLQILVGTSVATGLISLLTCFILADGDYINLSEVDSYIETQGNKIIISPLPKEYSFEHGVGTPNPNAQARTILVFQYDSTFEKGYLCDHRGFLYKLSQADTEYLIKKTRKGDLVIVNELPDDVHYSNTDSTAKRYLRFESKSGTRRLYDESGNYYPLSGDDVKILKEKGLVVKE